MNDRLAEEPLADWERELLNGGQPAPVSTLWSTSSTGSVNAQARGEHFTVNLTEDTVIPGVTRDGSIAFASKGKKRAAKHAFSRLTDGERHPVTVRQR